MTQRKLVPVDPTPEMLAKGAFPAGNPGLAKSAYEVMLDAAPEPDDEMVERVAKVISGAPFPSKRSLAKARSVIAAMNGE